ncbi:MAG: acyltransferase family protein, partial [Spirochaetales bacterium]|nr:acyltransferase family protein [Spirochaetales bacterium]
IFILMAEILLRPLYPGYQNLINDWANFVVYLTFFLLGFFWGGDERVLRRGEELFVPFLTLSLLSTALFLFCHISESVKGGMEPYLLAGLKGIAEYSWVMVFMVLGRRFLNRSNPLLKGLSRSSFGLYQYHFFLLTVINGALLPLGINHFVKFLVSVLFTYGAYYLLYGIFVSAVGKRRLLCGR